ncbi:MAG: sorbosone dehydrogenase family protein [Acidobacteria bacterium]|nr:sorbosone dehydrogenase family protein [Acidobacteriota bacterium]
MRRSTFLLSLSGAASATVLRAQKDAKLPPPFHTPSANNRPQVIDRPNGAQLMLPRGFVIDEYASGGFERPRFMLQAPGGEILISDAVARGSVIALIDKGKTNKATERRKILEGLDRPYGLAFWRDYLYVAETTSLKRYKFDPKTLTAGKGEEVVNMSEFGVGHWTRTVLFDAKGEKMYLAIGSRSNVDAGEPDRRAAINRFNPDGTGHEIYAAGTRNPIGMRWYPGSNTLWAAVQERDGLGDDLVPDYFTSIQQGGFYGWPFSYIGPNEDPRRKGERPELVRKTIVPDVPMGAHVAVLDALFYTGKQFPASYQGGAFVCQHGSWNRSERIGYNVVFIPFKNGKPSGPKTEFLGGWMLDKAKREVWGRPVGLLQLPDGSLLVSDDGGNKVWRISYKG